MNYSNQVIAMQEEIDVLHQKNTNIVWYKQVFKTKYKDNGSMDIFKAQLVVKGLTRISLLDIEETFSPIVKPTTIRVIFSIAIISKWQTSNYISKMHFWMEMSKKWYIWSNFQYYSSFIFKPRVSSKEISLQFETCTTCLV